MKICVACKRCFGDGEDSCFDPGHGKLSDRPHSIDVVPGYLIERVITSAPKSSTYEARQTEYGQECFITIVEGDSPKFLSDAQLAARLFHAGVAGVIESGELSDGSCYAASEGFAGVSLRDVISEGSSTLLERVRVARQAAEAVQAIHSAGLFHGALRPKNVSMTGIGIDEMSVKIHNIDLGSSMADGFLANRFAIDSALESIRYFAPERFRGEPPTAQSDVYSLGLLLYELLSGHPPFEAPSAAAVIEMHLNQKPADVTIENFDLRMLLTHTITESLQKQPSFRQSTADLFARQLRHVEQLATHVSTPPPAVAVMAARPVASNRVVPAEHVRPEPRPVAVPNIQADPLPDAARVEVSSRAVAPPVSPDPIPLAVPAIEPAPVAAAPNIHAAVDPAPIALTIEPEPILVVPAIEPPLVEVPRPIETARVNQPAPVEVASLQTTAHPEAHEIAPATNGIPLADPIAYVPTPSKRSRLKGMKKRLHSQILDLKADPRPATPTLIEWQQPVDDIPSEAEAREEMAHMGISDGSIEPDEEITHVRAPERIHVSWESPKNVGDVQLAADYFRTFLSDRPESSPPSQVDGDMMFSRVQSPSRDLGRLPVYAVAAFATLLLGFGFFQLAAGLSDQGDGYIGESRRPATQGQPAPASDSRELLESEPESQVAAVDIPAELIVVPSTTNEVEDRAIARVSEPSTGETPNRMKADEAAPAVRAKQSAKKDVPLVPSTMVISASAGKPKVIVVSDAPPFGSAKLANEMRNRSGGTRPRIVQVPR